MGRQAGRPAGRATLPENASKLIARFRICKTVERQIAVFAKFASSQASISTRLKNGREAAIFCRDAYSVIDTAISVLIDEGLIWETAMLADIYDQVDWQMGAMFSFFGLSDKDIRWVQFGK